MELIERIREAGVVGAGGAGFPTDKKLDCRADVFIVNGIECNMWDPKTDELPPIPYNIYWGALTRDAISGSVD